MKLALGINHMKKKISKSANSSLSSRCKGALLYIFRCSALGAVLASPFGRGAPVRTLGRRGHIPGTGTTSREALSVTFGDSSPKGRAKGGRNRVCAYKKRSVSILIRSVNCLTNTPLMLPGYFCVFTRPDSRTAPSECCTHHRCGCARSRGWRRHRRR